MVSLMLRMCRHIFVSGKAVVLDSGFCVAKVIIEIGSKGVYTEDLNKNKSYLTKEGTGELIDTHFEDKDVGDFGMIEAITEDNNLFKIYILMGETDYLMNIMAR